MLKKCEKFVQLNVKEETKELLLGACKREFLRHNPKMIGVNITHDVILRRVCEHYLDD